MKTLVRNHKCMVSVLLALLIVFGTFGIGDVQAQKASEPRTVRLFYFVPNDRRPRQKVVNAMKTGIRQVQSFYADQMEGHGYGRRTFRIETDAQGTPIVHHVNGDDSDSYYKRSKQPKDEIRRDFDTSSIVQLIVMDLSRLSGGNAVGIKQGGMAIIFGDWDRRTAAHELGHAFGLQHDFRDDAYIMSYGDNLSALSPGAAHFLAVNPYFNNRVPLQQGSLPSIQLVSSTQYSYGATSVPVTVRVRDSDGLQQISLFVKTPAGLLNRPAGFMEVIAYRNMSGQTDTTITFNYDGKIPTLNAINLKNQLQHTIYISAVDKQGNRIEPARTDGYTLQAINVPELNVPLRNRSPRVAESIYNTVRLFQDRNVSAYEHITDAHLADITNMNVNHIRASDSPLQSNDFDGLTGLSRLELRFESGYSENTLLPARIFKGLTSLSSVQMKYYKHTYGEDPQLYPILPFPVGLKKVGRGQFKAVVHTGAPSDMELPLHVVNGNINGGAKSIMIPAGSVESDVLTVTRTPGTTAAVIVDLERTVASPSPSGYAFYKSSFHLQMFNPLVGAHTPVTERTPQVIEAIVGEVPGIDYAHHDRNLRYMVNGRFIDKKYNAAHYVSEAQLAAITSLIMSGNRTAVDSVFGGLAGNWFSQHGNITALKRSDFGGMTNLETLTLSGNALRSLPDGLFDDLTNLEKLNLSSNALRSLPDGLFDDLTNLTTLSLFNNGLSSLPDGLFDDLANLEKLNLSSNALRSLPDGLFDDLTNLTYLNLVDNPLLSLPAGYFDNLPNLETLLLPKHIAPPPLPEASGITPVADRTPQVRDAIVAAAGVNTVANVTAAHFAKITELDLSESNITALKSGDFDNLINLEALGIGGGFSSLPDGIFDNLVNLKVLSLNNNRLRSLPNGILDQLTNLWVFVIADSQLHALPDGIFDQLTRLSYLAIVDTQLSSLPSGIFDNFTNVPIILLRNNRLRSLPDGIFDKATMVVDLSNNQLSALPNGIFEGIFDAPPDLSGFSLLDIPLGQVPQGTFDDIDYTTLNLTGNRVDPLPLTVSLERVGSDQFKAVAPTGAPIELVLPITVANSSIAGGTTNITIPIGNTESNIFTVTRALDTTLPISVDIETLPELPENHTGYTLVKSPNLPLVFTGFRGGFSINERTPEVRDAILKEVGVNSAGDVTAAHLAAITELGVRLSNSVKVGDFKGLTGLTALDLFVGQLTSLPVGLFNDLDNVTHLVVRGEHLTALPAAIFDGFTNLETLHLLSRQSISLPVDIFDNLANLTTLSLNGGLTSLPVGLFSGLSSLKTLDLSGNTVNPLPLTVSLEKVGDGQFKAVAPIGAPFDIVLPLTVTNGSINGGATTATIPAGSVESGTLTLIRTLGTKAPVTANIGALPGLPQRHRGYALVKSTNLPLEVIEILANHAPVFTEGTRTTRAVVENTATHTNIGTPIAATDADNDALTYTLGGTDAAAFSIVSTSGQLQTRAALDYETKASYAVTVSVSDGKGGSDSITVTINVTDVDERTIDPPLSQRTRQVRDAIVAVVPGVNSAANVTAAHLAAITSLSVSRKEITSLKIGDFDGLTALEWLSLGYNNLRSLPSGIFDQNTALTHLSFNDNDISSLPSGIFDQNTALRQIEFGDNNLRSLPSGIFDQNTALWQIKLNDNALSSLPSGIFDQNSALSNLWLYNNALSSLPSGIFDNNTGLKTLNLSANKISDVSELEGVTSLSRLSLNGNPISDYGPLRRLIAAIEAIEDHPGLTLDITIPAEITNNTPVFIDGTQATRAVAENTASGVNIGNAIAATDADSGDTLTYSLGGTNAAIFAVDSTTGQLKTKAALDYETKASYSVTVSVSDGNGGSDTIPVTINVTDVVENRGPVFTHGTSTTRSIVENTAADVNIGTPITATDADNHVLTYTLSGTDAASFTIDSTTGQLKTKSALDYETKAVYTVTITASDGILTDTITVTVSITDMDELPSNTAPVFTDGASTTRSIAEDTVAGVNIGIAVAATDADSDTLTYTLGGADAAAFSIVSTSGQLQTRAALDYETKVAYSVTVSVSDGNGGSDSITVTINVTDVAENSAPVFTDGTRTTRSVAENTAAGQHIGAAVGATDADNHVLIYTLSGTDATSFTIDNATGQLKTKSALDYETKAVYTVTITASDGILTDTIAVTINVTDINELPSNTAPVFSDGESLTIPMVLPPKGKTEADYDVGNPLLATDADGDRVTYSLSGTDANLFHTYVFGKTVNGQGQGYVQLTTRGWSLHDANKSSFTVIVTASDFDGASDSITVTVNVTDVNENTAPVFADGTTATRTVVENTAANINIGAAIAATDADGDTLTYTLGGADAAAFVVDGTTAQLKTKAALDYETKNAYTVTITASDGSLTSTITVTINITDTVEVPTVPTGTPEQPVQPKNIDAPEEPVATGVTPTLSVSTPSPLTEAILHEGVVTLTLSDGIYVRSVWDIRGAVSVSGIAGVTVPWNQPKRKSDTEITITLAFDGTNFDTASTLTFTVGADAIAGYNGPALTTRLSVAALTESVVATTAPLTEAALDGSVVTLTLNGRKYARSQSKIRDAVSVSGIQGVTVRRSDIDRVNDTEVTAELTFKGNIDSDGTLTFTIGADAIAGYNGPTLTAKVPVSASTEVPAVADETAPAGDETPPAADTTSPRVCKVGDILAPGASCTYPGTDTKFSVNNNGLGQFLFFNNGNRLSLENTEINGKSYTLVAGKLASGSWKIERIGDNAAQQPGTPEQPVQPEDTGTPEQPIATGGTPTLSVTTAIPLTEATLHGGIITLNLSNGTFESSRFRIRNAVSVSGIDGLTVERFGGEGISDTQATIELEYDGHMTANDTLTISVGAGAIKGYDGTALTAQISVLAVTESVTASTAAPLTEATLDDSVVTLTLSGRKFEPRGSTIRSGVSVSGISGLTVGTFDIERQSDTEVTVELSFNGNLDADRTLTLTVQAYAIAGYNGPALTTQVSVSAGADAPAETSVQNPDPPEPPQQLGDKNIPEQPVGTGISPTLRASTPSPLTEAILHEGIVTLTLNNGAYDRSKFTIERALTVSGITGVTIDAFGVDRVSDTRVTLALEYDGNLNTDSTLTFSIGADAIADYNGAALTAQIPVTAVTESIVASTSGALTEATLNGSVVTLTLSGRSFESSNSKTRGSITVSGIAGVTARGFDIVRVSDTQVTVKLTFKGDLTTNGTLTFTVEADAIAGYKGPSLTVQVAVSTSARNENNGDDDISVDWTCSAQPRKGDVLDVTIEGTITANRDVRIQLVTGYVGDSVVGTDILNINLARGQSVDFAVTGPWVHNGVLKPECSVEVNFFTTVGGGNGAPSLLAIPTKIALEGQRQIHRISRILPVVPVKTVLLPNYPNPFNPETWIPYQLSKDADVTLTIYAVNGQVVRRLALGHQPAGMYQSRSRAAYWDGKNAFREPVASGVYFYTLSTESTRDSVTAGDFTATRKMLIRK